MKHPIFARERSVQLLAMAVMMLWPTYSALAAGQGVVLAPHRAVYEMTLAEARGGAGVTQVTGRMVYELTGSACEGYTQNMRFVTSMANQSGSTTVSDLRSSSWEDASAKRFRFSSSQFRDDKPTEATAGEATRAPTGNDVKVDLTKPAKKTLPMALLVGVSLSPTLRCRRNPTPLLIIFFFFFIFLFSSPSGMSSCAIACWRSIY